VRLATSISGRPATIAGVPFFLSASFFSMVTATAAAVAARRHFTSAFCPPPLPPPPACSLIRELSSYPTTLCPVGLCPTCQPTAATFYPPLVLSLLPPSVDPFNPSSFSVFSSCQLSSWVSYDSIVMISPSRHPLDASRSAYLCLNPVQCFSNETLPGSAFLNFQNTELPILLTCLIPPPFLPRCSFQ